MLRLDLCRDPAWIDLLPGLSVQAAPVTTVVLTAARHTALESPDAPESPAARETAFLKVVARLVILAWRGVGAADGAPLPVTPEGVDALMDLYPVAAAFADRVIAPALSAEALLDAEKKGCTAAHAGISAAARPIAEPAAAPAAPAAPASPAPTAPYAPITPTSPAP